jgi:hypothetical protein
MRKAGYDSMKSVQQNKKNICTRGGEIMKKVLSHLTHSWVIVVILFFSICPALALETNALIPSIEILTPGMGRSITITQNYDFPQGSNQFLVLLIGSGVVGITLSKYDTEGDLLVMTGAGISSAGIVPFFKRGKTSVYLDVGIEIGDEHSPYGLVWFSSWIDKPDEEDNTYDISLSF